MHEFQSFVYLDVEKTGSAFITSLLRRYCGEEQVRRNHHEPMEADCDRSKFYFISTRDPMETYLSLYSYGCDEKGKLRGQLGRNDLDKFYTGDAEGFNDWLAFVLNGKNAKYLGDDYSDVAGGHVARKLGLMSYRYLRLAIPDAAGLLKDVKRSPQIYQVYAANRLPQFVVRHETFRENLCELIAGPLRHAFADQDGAINYVRTALPVNASDRVDAYEARFRIKQRLRDRMREREWLLRDLYGY
jgi:hypothetical protein